MRRNLLGKDLVKSSMGRERIKGEVISEIGCEKIKYGKGLTFAVSLESRLNARFFIRTRLILYLKDIQIFHCKINVLLSWQRRNLIRKKNSI